MAVKRMRNYWDLSWEIMSKGSVSISLWKNTFKVALSLLCPMRGAGHECGCLTILAKTILDNLQISQSALALSPLESCYINYLAMFNAILRESEHQIPTDPCWRFMH
ncbi:unnamed protein product [Arabidopsis halleri]